MYDSSYNANPNITLNPFTASLEAVVVFKANKEFLDSLTKAVVDCGGSPENIVRPDITLTELMNKLSINGVRFMFDVNAKRGGSTVIPEVTEVKNEQESALNELTDLSQELKLY